jgi:hypothetical protein
MAAAVHLVIMSSRQYLKGTQILIGIKIFGSAGGVKGMAGGAAGQGHGDAPSSGHLIEIVFY